MEEITVNIINLITSYGALGMCCAYFMYKDYKLNQSIEETLDKFTIAINALIGKGVD